MRKQVLTASLVIAAIAPDVLVAGQKEAENIRPSLVENHFLQARFVYT